MDKKKLPDNQAGQSYPEPDVPVEDAWNNMKQLLQHAPAAPASRPKFSFGKSLGAGRIIIGAGVVAIIAVITYVATIKKEKPAPLPTKYTSDTIPGTKTGKDTTIAYQAIQQSKTVSHEFSNTPFTEVARFIEKEYGVTIIVKNKAINNCKVTTRFDNISLKEILDILGYTLAFEYKIDQKKNQVTISGNGCN